MSNGDRRFRGYFVISLAKVCDDFRLSIADGDGHALFDPDDLFVAAGELHALNLLPILAAGRPPLQDQRLPRLMRRELNVRGQEHGRRFPGARER